MTHPFFGKIRPCAIGHRGAAGELPENTLSSFERALARGAAILESDLQTSADGVPVLFHDATLERTTDGAGRVSEHPLVELRRLDAAHHFRPADGAERSRSSEPPLRRRGYRIPSLEEALDTFSGAHFNLELKDPNPMLTGATLRAIRERGCAERVLLTAEDTNHMAAVRRAVAEAGLPVALGACVGDVIEFVKSLAGGTPPPAVSIAGQALGPMALQVPPRTEAGPLVDAAFVEHAHAFGLFVHVWTINDPLEIEALLELGVDGLVSDFPERVVSAIARRAERE